jgi:hypothetical protein
MAKNIKLTLSSNNENVYFDSFNIINQLLREKNVYPSSQKRIMMSKFLYGLIADGTQVGFVSASKDEKYYPDILSLDLCLLKQYRLPGMADKILPKVVTAIEQNRLYDNEFIIIEKSRSHDEDVKGIDYSNKIVLLQDRLSELNNVHPDGINKPTKVVNAKHSYTFNNKERK